MASPSLCIAWWGFTDVSLGPEKVQPGDDEADLEKLQELLVRDPHLYVKIGNPQYFKFLNFLGKSNE